jgi:hypothetical protein
MALFEEGPIPLQTAVFAEALSRSRISREPQLSSDIDDIVLGRVRKSNSYILHLVGTADRRCRC